MKIIDIWLLKYKSRHTEFFAILGQFLSFHTSDNLENQNFENLKKKITHVYIKWQSMHAWFLRYGAKRTEFFVILDCFLPFYFRRGPENYNFGKKEKNNRRYYDFPHVYQKSQSYDLCFQRLEHIAFCHFGPFLDFLPH